MRWKEHIAHMRKGQGYTGFWWRNLRERDNLGDRGVDGNIILRWILKRLVVGVWFESIWLRIGIGGGHF
jgi:hypothetical protein